MGLIEDRGPLFRPTSSLVSRGLRRTFRVGGQFRSSLVGLRRQSQRRVGYRLYDFCPLRMSLWVGNLIPHFTIGTVRIEKTKFPVGLSFYFFPFPLLMTEEARDRKATLPPTPLPIEVHTCNKHRRKCWLACA